MKLGWILFISLFFSDGAFCQNQVVEDFIGEGESPLMIDLEEETGVRFDVVDEIAEREKKLEEALRIPQKPTIPRSIIKAEPYTAQLKKNAVLTTIDGKKKVVTKRGIIVKAQEVSPGSQNVFILSKNGEKKYFTKTKNALNIMHVTDIEPDINPLTVYTDEPTYQSIDGNARFSHFLSMHFEAISTEYYATIFRGEKGSANSTTIQLKNYILSDKFPIHVGFNIANQLGFWEDPVLGTVTWNAVLFGPSIMRTFWKKDDSRWNFHLSAFRSLFHESEKEPDRHEYSTLGFQGEIEKEIDTQVGPLTLGVSYRWSQSSIKSTTEFLQNEAQKGEVVAFGAYLSYRFNWSL